MDFQVNPGDLVRVIAPGGRGAAQNLPLIKSYVESLGLVADISPNIYDPSDPFYSNTDEFRANDLISSILNPDCKIIWCIRGGSGCNRLIRYLDEGLPPSAPSPKLLIGYSDITVLHIYLQRKYNWVTIHGAMLEAIITGFYPRSSASVTNLVDLIFSRLETICYTPMVRLDDGPPISDPIRGSIVGGNLTLIEASVGTTWEMDATDKIVIIEDISVAAYSMERSLEHLKQCVTFAKAKAVIFGDFTSADSQQLIRLVEDRFAMDKNYIACPVFLIQGIGHGPVNIPMPLNSRVGAEIKLVGTGSTYELCDTI